MKKTYPLSILLLISIHVFSQTEDTLSEKNKIKFIPAIKLGGNYAGYFSGEAGFFFGMSRKNLHKPSTSLSTMCHGPSLGCEIGNWTRGNFAPKISYEYSAIFYGGRISLVDYIQGNNHNLYISPEAGMSYSAFIMILAGANIPVSGEVKEVSTFRLSVIVNLYTRLFQKQ